jgi:hypothetical protein
VYIPWREGERVNRLTILVVALTVAVLTVAAIPGSGEVAAQDLELEDTLLSAEEALLQDAEMYASDYEVPLEEAIRRLRLQDYVGELSAG